MGFVLGSLNLGLSQESQSRGDLKVNVTGMKHNEGKVIVNLFRKGDDVMGKPFIQKYNKIMDGEAQVVFEELPFSSYVVFAFHDENDNGTMDHNWLNIPKEPMGYSNNWNFSLFSGMPSYKKTKFEFSEKLNDIIIRVK